MDKEIISHFKNEARTAIRKSEKLGVKVLPSENFSDFYPILEENLWRKRKVKPTHSLEELKRLKALLPDKIKLFISFLGSKPIGGITLFVCNPRVVLAFYISHLPQYQSYRPVNLLFYEVIRWAFQSGYQYLDLGTFTLNMMVDWGLARFKENFGAKGFFRDSFLWENED